MENIPLENLYNQIKILMDIIKQNSNQQLKGELPPGIEQKVADLEKAVTLFCEINNEALAESKKNVVEDKQMAMYEPESNLSKEDRKFLTKLMELKEEVIQAKQNLGIDTTGKRPPKHNSSKF
jgi:hypothetical protein